MKRRIRITESKLKKIISESVKNIISELDARTYASARDKASARGQFDRASKFHNAAVDSFNKQQGLDGVDIRDAGNHEYTMSMNNDGTVDYRSKTYVDPIEYNYKEYYNPHTGSIESTTDDKNYEYYPPRRTYFKQSFKPKYSEMDDQYQVAKQMADGSGRYIKGKGWK